MTTAPESLPAIALVFCRECLGWDVHGAFPGVLRETPTDDALCGTTPAGDYSVFAYTDLDSVMDAVYAWCDPKHRAWLSISLKPASEWTDWWVRFYDAEAVHADLRHALLAACVAANRQLKADTRIHGDA